MAQIRPAPSRLARSTLPLGNIHQPMPVGDPGHHEAGQPDAEDVADEQGDGEGQVELVWRAAACRRRRPTGRRSGRAAAGRSCPSSRRTAAPTGRSDSSRNHCSKPVRATRAWNSSVSGVGLLDQLLAHRRVEPGLEVGLAVEAQDGDVVLLHAGHRRLEAVALQARRLGLGGGDLALPGAVLGLLARLHAGADHGRDRRRLAAALRRRERCGRRRGRSASAPRPRCASARSGEASQRCASSMVSKRCRITQSTCSGGLGGISRCSMKPGKLGDHRAGLALPACEVLGTAPAARWSG